MSEPGRSPASAPNLVLIVSDGRRTREIGRYPEPDAAKAAAREAAGAALEFGPDADHGGWRARSGDLELRILEPGAAARYLEMADTETSGGTVDLEMDQSPHRPDAG